MVCGNTVRLGAGQDRKRSELHSLHHTRDSSARLPASKKRLFYAMRHVSYTYESARVGVLKEIMASLSLSVPRASESSIPRAEPNNPRLPGGPPALNVIVIVIMTTMCM